MIAVIAAFEGVIANAAAKGVAAFPAKQPVLAVATIELIALRAAVKEIIAIATVKHIAVCPAIQLVVLGATFQAIFPYTTVKNIVTLETKEEIGFPVLNTFLSERGRGILARPSLDGAVPIVTDERVVSGVSDKIVSATIANQEVVAVLTHDDVTSGHTPNQIVTAIAVNVIRGLETADGVVSLLVTRRFRAILRFRDSSVDESRSSFLVGIAPCGWFKAYVFARSAVRVLREFRFLVLVVVI